MKHGALVLSLSMLLAGCGEGNLCGLFGSCGGKTPITAGADAGTMMTHGNDAGVAEPPADGGTSTAREIGAPCRSDRDCGAQSLCITSFPGGYCTTPCDAANRGCPSGSECFEEGGSSACLKRCAASGDCRVSEGYTCDADHACFPSSMQPDAGTTVADAGAPDAGAAGCTQICNGLVSMWTFDEGSGVLARDSLGRNDAKLEGTFVWRPANGGCRKGGCVSLDTNAFAQVLSPTGLPLGAATRTMTIWVKPRGGPAGAPVPPAGMVQYGGTQTAGSAFGLMVPPSNPGRVAFLGRSADVLSSATLVANQWTHVAVAFDGATVKLYVNGVADTQLGRALSTVNNVTGLVIGWRPDTNNFWNGDLDEIRLYERELAPAEVMFLAMGR